MAHSKYWVWLQNCIGFGSPRIDDIVTNFKDIEYFYNNLDECLPKISNIRKSEYQKFKTTSLEMAENIVRETQKRGYEVIGYDDEKYPNRLRNIYASPAVLYVSGDLGDIDNSVLVAVVGSRVPSPYGHDAAVKISSEIAKSGITVVSGLADGIDTAAHIGTVKAGGKTIAVLGCGLDVYYPKVNAKLQNYIAKNGAVISEYPLGTKPNSCNFPIRNRIISGISLGVLVVEASVRSGSLITANCAVEQGKDVFSVPGSIFSDLSRGTFKLLYEGAIPVSCGNDIVNEYKRQYNLNIIRNNSETIKKTDSDKAMSSVKDTSVKVPEWLVGTLKTVYEALTYEPALIDDIINRLSLPLSDVLCALTELEMSGLALSHPGNKFSKK